MTSVTPLGPTPPITSVAAARTVTTNDTPPLAQPSASASGSAGGSVQESINPGLDITVLKFFSAAGDLTQSFPSQRQLASYQLYGLGGSEEGQGSALDPLGS